MWYDSSMPNRLPKDALRQAHAAVVFAHQTRKHYRRRPDRNKRDREKDIQKALDRIRRAMAPIRSEIGRFAHQPCDVEGLIRREKIRKASQDLQRERRKLFKMQQRSIGKS